jgi:octaprenyl-diphosphate synthase
MLPSVLKVIESELKTFDDYYTRSLDSKVPLLKEIMDYLLKNKGKQIRPVFSMLCSRMGGPLNEKSYRAAAVVEMLHTASLIHDDVLDESMERRGVHSVNALWKNKASVLAGDWLSLNALLLTLSQKDYGTFEIYAGAIEKIVNGEITQYKKTFKLNLDEGTYFEIIRAKTAAFFAAACAAGAASTFDDPLKIQQWYLFGEKLGIAFQLKDDLLDYGNVSIGKPTGHDIRDKKLTLPLIYTLAKCEPSLKRKILRIIRNRNKEEDRVNFVIREVHNTGGIGYTHTRMLGYKDEALKILNSFPASDCRLALEELVTYITDRTY